MQKRGKDKRSLFTNTTVLILAVAGSFLVFWLFNRESSVKILTYGELMQILMADDPGLHLQNVNVGRTEIRGEIVTTDMVSNGKTVPELLVEKPMRGGFAKRV